MHVFAIACTTLQPCTYNSLSMLMLDSSIYHETNESECNLFVIIYYNEIAVGAVYHNAVKSKE